MNPAENLVMTTSSSTIALTEAPQTPPLPPQPLPPPTPGTPDITTLVTPPLSPNTRSDYGRAPRLTKAHSVSNSISSTHREYLDSLPIPTKQEFDHIAQIQAEREADQKRRNRQLQRQSLDLSPQASPPLPSDHRDRRRRSFLSKLGFGHRSSPSDQGRENAATLIQRTYRGYRARREIKGLSLDASTRWMHAVREAQWRELTRPRPRSALLEDGFSYFGPRSSDGGGVSGDDERGILAGTTRSPTARSRWKKASTVARRAGGDADKSSSSSSSSSSSDSESDQWEKEQRKLENLRRKEAKVKRKQDSRMMGLQYFLEMVDLKHRYGANLRVYHEAWQQADTNENFFYWLDHGEGRDIDIEVCPRETLEREQVRYLSREERQHYLVKVDDQGRLCWAKNGARIDTTEKWKDSVKGIVPIDDPTPAYTPVSEGNTNFLGDSHSDDNSSITSSSSSSSSSSSDSSDSKDSKDERAAANHYATPPGRSHANGAVRKRIKHVSAGTVFNKLLRKSVRKNTWIFVADTSFRLYVGLKNSGAFQHSSFLQGSRISAAGLIKIKDGKLHSLSPLSGHYRPPASNFRAFVHSLKEEGVDMSSVSISKSYAVLVGLEAYTKVRSKVKKVRRRREKEKIVKMMEEVAEEDKKKEPENTDEERVMTVMSGMNNLRVDEQNGQRGGVNGKSGVASDGDTDV